MSDFLEKLLIWDNSFLFETVDELSKSIKDSILGGNNVHMTKLKDLFKEDPEEKVSDIIDIDWKKQLLFVMTTVASFGLNSYAIVSRWIERPERNPEVFHNWSMLAVIHIEFCGIVIMFSSLSANILMLMINKSINTITKDYNINIDYSDNIICLLLSILCCSFVFFPMKIIYNTINIFNEEYELFYNGTDILPIESNYTELDNYTQLGNYTELNNTTIDYDNQFSNIDIHFFIPFSIVFFSYHLLSNSYRFSTFNERYTGPDPNIPLHDPFLLRKISSSIQNISRFSILRIVAWTRIALPKIIKTYIHNLTIISKELSEDMNICLGCLYYIVVQILGCFFYIWCCCESVIPYIFGSIIIFMIPLCISFLGFITKVEQVSFVSSVEILDWDKSQWIQFIAFLNNMFSLDRSKDSTMKFALTFLFAGEDGKESIFEIYTQNFFMNMLTSYSILRQGWYKTIILLIQLDPTDLQQLLVREDKEYSDEKEKINKEKIKEKKNTMKRTKSEYNQVDEDNEESIEVTLEA
tara:strand:- start:538 stop:2112 length:1575 start_codon:yes stop_codon:yes gene_type:complete